MAGNVSSSWAFRQLFTISNSNELSSEKFQNVFTNKIIKKNIKIIQIY